MINSYRQHNMSANMRRVQICDVLSLLQTELRQTLNQSGAWDDIRESDFIMIAGTQNK
jgi:hypothetical protein